MNIHKPQYIIIGQGIAGSILSMQMTNAGIAHIVIDEPTLSSSSKIAAGIINPIVLKRLKIVKDATLFMPLVQTFYTNWEKRLKTSFYFPLPIYHLLHTVHEQNSWMEKAGQPFYQNFLGDIICDQNYTSDSSYSWGRMKQTAWVHTHQLLLSYCQFLEKQNIYRQIKITTDNISQLKKEFPESRIIWCTGHLMSGLSSFTRQLFRPTRGELITIHTPDIAEDKILHSRIFILPQGNHLFRVGASYHWDNLEDKPSREGREYLIRELQKIYTGTYKIINHQAGVRPNTVDRKPLLGKLGNDFVFNGLGSRGLLMAPYLANLFIDFLKGKTSLPDSYNIDRFT